MTTSIHGGIVGFGDALYGTDDDPVGNGVSRDGVLNGLLHAADSMGQARVNWHPISSSVANGQASSETIDAPSAASQWAMFGGSPFGQWPLTLRADGTPYRLRVRVAGRLDLTPSGGEEATIRVVIAPSYLDAVAIRDTSVDYVWSATVTSTTAAWLTGATPASSFATYMDVPAAAASAWIDAVVPTYDAVSSASPVTVQQCLVSAWVFGRCDDDIEIRPELHALYISEVPAP